MWVVTVPALVLALVVVTVRPLSRALWRFAFGLPMDGFRRSDAGFFRKGERDFTKKANANRWDYLPYYQRAAIRWISLAGLLTLLVGWFVARWAVETLFALGVVGGLVWVGFRVFPKIRHWAHIQRTVKPLYKSIQKNNLPILPKTWSQKTFWVTPNYSDIKTSRVRLELRKDWQIDPSTRFNLKTVLGEHLEGEWSPEWNWSGEKPFVEWRLVPEPPKALAWKDVAEEARALPSSQIFYGKDEMHNKIVIDLDADTPHVLLSMGTGAGKSATLMLMITQLIAKPDIERIIIIDPKRRSLNIFAKVEGIWIYRDASTWEEAIDFFYDEMERRKNDGDDEADEDHEVKYPRWVLVLEELNTFAELSKQYWDEIRPKGSNKTPPWIKKIALILFQSRQFNMNIIADGQEVTAETVGSNAARSQFGFKALSRFSPQVYKQLTGGSKPPKVRNVIGRHLLIHYGNEKQVQAVFMSKKEVRKELKSIDFRLAGLDYGPSQISDFESTSPMSPENWQGDFQEQDQVYVPGHGDNVIPFRPSRTQEQATSKRDMDDTQEIPVITDKTPDPRVVQEPTEPVYTIKEASVDEGLALLPMKYEALKRERSRSKKDGGEFPESAIPGAKPEKYTEDQLIGWYNNRTSTIKPLPRRTGPTGTGE